MKHSYFSCKRGEIPKKYIYRKNNAQKNKREEGNQFYKGEKFLPLDINLK